MTHRIRIISKLEVKGENVVKGMRMEGLRKVGDPAIMAHDYCVQGADEILFIDIVASLYDRNNLNELVTQVAGDITIPLTVGGGIRSVDDFQNMLRSGADKISLNTAIIKSPELITELAQIYGSQAVIVSAQSKKIADGEWEIFIENGRQQTGVNAVEWVHEAQERGAGEILLTSVDHDGTRQGPDLELISRAREQVKIPLLVCGGIGSIDDVEAMASCRVDGIVMAYCLHFQTFDIPSVKERLHESGFEVR